MGFGEQQSHDGGSKMEFGTRRREQVVKLLAEEVAEKLAGKPDLREMEGRVRELVNSESMSSISPKWRIQTLPSRWMWLGSVCHKINL